MRAIDRSDGAQADTVGARRGKTGPRIQPLPTPARARTPPETLPDKRVRSFAAFRPSIFTAGFRLTFRFRNRPKTFPLKAGAVESRLCVSVNQRVAHRNRWTYRLVTLHAEANRPTLISHKRQLSVTAHGQLVEIKAHHNVDARQRCTFVQYTNMKSRTSLPLVAKSVTLNDLERRHITI